MSDKWERRFMAMADLVGSWSKDISTQVGAVIVRPDRTITSVGYNGFPRGLSDNQFLYSDRDTKLSRIIHAEMNALLSAPEPVKGHTLYLSQFLCCDRCAAHVIQAGIVRVVAREPTAAQNDRWGRELDVTRAMFAEAGVAFEERAR